MNRAIVINSYLSAIVILYYAGNRLVRSVSQTGGDVVSYTGLCLVVALFSAAIWGLVRYERRRRAP